jgi:hypothetical protein
MQRMLGSSGLSEFVLCNQAEMFEGHEGVCRHAGLAGGVPCTLQ